MTAAPSRGGSRPRSAAADTALVAAFAALIIVLGGVAVPVGGLAVPIVLQNMGVALAAMLLGWRRGLLATLLFVGVGLLGVPNLAGWRTTLSALPGPSIGYVLGYVVAAALVGAIAERAPRSPGRTVARTAVLAGAGLLGVAVQYLLGSTVLAARTGMSFGGAVVSNAAFVPGDVAKVVLAAVVAVAVLRAVPDLLPDRTARA